MHIKHIHELIEKLSECACSELSSGIENVNTCEMGQVIDMIKDLADAEYHARISKAMEEADEDEKEEEKYLLKMFKDQYGEEDARRYYDEYRYKSGRFAPKGHGMRRGYNEPPYWHMTPLIVTWTETSTEECITQSLNHPVAMIWLAVAIQTQEIHTRTRTRRCMSLNLT